MEKPFEFTKKLLEVHKPSRINRDKMSELQGVKVNSEWKISLTKDATIVLQNAAADLQEYFEISMECKVDIETADAPSDKRIFISVDESMPERTFRIIVETANDTIRIIGSDDRSAAQGCYSLEDEMNLNEAPILEPCDKTMHMRFSPRIIFSGMQFDNYPDEHLRMIAHAGIDAIQVGITADIITNPERSSFVSEIIERAAKFGIDVYSSNRFKNLYHPDDKEAYEYYNNTYGKLFDVCPKLKGLFIVGECCEFPSNDIRTTGKSWRESLNDEKPSPGWFPCNDYPQFISMVSDVIRAHSTEAELVFWTYNWGYEKQELREELLRNMPEGVTLMATFEMFEEINISPEIQEFTTDYTLWQIGPGKYFKTESAIAKERNMRMIAMTNTGGNTWDVGAVPYLPAPQRWIKRWKAVAESQDNLRLDGVRESHTYGFWPSILPEIAKYAYMVPMPDLDKLLERIVVRDFGVDNKDDVLKSFELFSEGMEHCVSTNEDQYGPARVGPAYPLFYKRWELIPKGPESKGDVNYEGYPVYTYNLDRVEKLQYETAEYKKMARLFDEGTGLLSKVILSLSGRKKQDAEELLGVAKFIANTARTVYHVKRWHYLKGRLGVYVDAKPVWVGGRKNMPDAKKAEKPLVAVENPKPIIQELIDIINLEIKNAEDTIPLVEANSRLGYNQEFDYCCAPEQLKWKIEMAKRTLNDELLPLLQNNV